MGAGHFHIGPAVADAHYAAVHRGEDGAEGGTDDAGNATQTHQGAGDQRSGGTGGNQCGDVIPVPEEDDGLHHRRIALEAHHVRRLLVAADDFRGVYDFQPFPVIVFPFQFLPEEDFVSGEHQVQVRIGFQGVQGSVNRGFGAVVSAETV